MAELDGPSHRVALVLQLLERLKWEPMSQYRAEMAGSDEFIGWTKESTILAAIWNAVAAGNKGKKLTKKEHYPVPEVKKTKKKASKPTSVKDLDWAKMMGGLHG